MLYEVITVEPPLPSGFRATEPSGLSIVDVLGLSGI